jgi:membrane protein DedA with SNARE-associated domain
MMRFLNSPAFSPLGCVGWALVLGGGGWDLIYHLAPLVAGVKWSPMIDLLGEFGHTVILVGMVIVVLAVLLYQHRKRMH